MFPFYNITLSLLYEGVYFGGLYYAIPAELKIFMLRIDYIHVHHFAVMGIQQFNCTLQKPKNIFYNILLKKSEYPSTRSFLLFIISFFRTSLQQAIRV